jgi:hypothetical protein
MPEPHGDLIDDLADAMSADEATGFRIDGARNVAAPRAILTKRHARALATDFTDPRRSERFWYVSQEKQGPRLGNRLSDAGADPEQPLCIARLAR